MDGSPIIDRTPIDGLYLNCGWCYGGFKATPASGYCFAHLLATGESHDNATAYKLNRFRSGAVIDEKGGWCSAQPALKGGDDDHQPSSSGPSRRCRVYRDR